MPANYPLISRASKWSRTSTIWGKSVGKVVCGVRAWRSTEHGDREAGAAARLGVGVLVGVGLGPGEGAFCATQDWGFSEQSLSHAPLLNRTRHPLEMVILLALLTVVGLPLMQVNGKYCIPKPQEDYKMAKVRDSGETPL